MSGGLDSEATVGQDAPVARGHGCAAEADTTPWGPSGSDTETCNSEITSLQFQGVGKAEINHRRLIPGQVTLA
jgi:hypothetical protein